MSEGTIKLDISLIEFDRREPVPVTEIDALTTHLNSIAAPHRPKIETPAAMGPDVALRRAIDESLPDLTKRFGATCRVYPVSSPGSKLRSYAVFAGPQRAADDTNKLFTAEVQGAMNLVVPGFVAYGVSNDMLTQIAAKTAYWMQHHPVGPVGTFIEGLMDLKGLPRYRRGSGWRSWVGEKAVIDTIIAPEEGQSDPALVGKKTLNDHLLSFTNGKVGLDRTDFAAKASSVARYVESVEQMLGARLMEIKAECAAAPEERIQQSAAWRRRQTEASEITTQLKKFQSRVGVSQQKLLELAAELEQQAMMFALAAMS